MGEKLNVGAGVSYIPGFRNIDIAPHAEITLNLNTDRLPFDDNSVDLVFSYHTLEHVENYLHALGEIHRVLRHGGLFYLGVPYITLTEFNLINPYHKTHFSEHSFAFFDPKRMLGTAAEPGAIQFHEIGHRFHYLKPFDRWPAWAQKLARRRLLNVVQKIDFCLVALKDDTPPVFDTDAKEHWKAFDQAHSGRQPYPKT